MQGGKSLHHSSIVVGILLVSAEPLGARMEMRSGVGRKRFKKKKKEKSVKAQN